MGKIWLKIKSHPPLTKRKLTLTSPRLLIILRSTPPLPYFLPALVPSYLIYVLDVFLRHKSTSNDSSTYEFCPSESLDSDSEIVSCSHELLNSSSSRTSLEALPRAWLTTRLVKSAILPLILRPRCFKSIFSWLFASAPTSFSFFQEILDGRVSFLLLFFSPALHPRTQGALHNLLC